MIQFAIYILRHSIKKGFGRSCATENFSLSTFTTPYPNLYIIRAVETISFWNPDSIERFKRISIRFYFQCECWALDAVNIRMVKRYWCVSISVWNYTWYTMYTKSYVYWQFANFKIRYWKYCTHVYMTWHDIQCVYMCKCNI